MTGGACRATGESEGSAITASETVIFEANDGEVAGCDGALSRPFIDGSAQHGIVAFSAGPSGVSGQQAAPHDGIIAPESARTATSASRPVFANVRLTTTASTVGQCV